MKSTEPIACVHGKPFLTRRFRVTNDISDHRYIHRVSHLFPRDTPELEVPTFGSWHRRGLTKKKRMFTLGLRGAK
jgi:hypothetical protein